MDMEKLQAELDWHKKELARVDHALVDACDRANKLQADLKSVNFSYWKKCEELSQLQEQNQKLRECLEAGYKYLKATYDIHTWHEEPEYAMMKSFEKCLKEIEGE